jgi:aspartokinase/homoserine dehydrogenase 1
MGRRHHRPQPPQLRLRRRHRQPEVASCYASLLQKSISVVACNKIACSSPYGNYRQLKDLAREYNARFLFETNVGAGLPVIGTLNDLLRSGDKVRRIEAVLSGTLNFVFNHYNGEKPFSEVVRQAQEKAIPNPTPASTSAAPTSCARS